MSPIARAAEIWAGIEAALRERGFWIRDEQRPELIRLVGRALGDRKTRATSVPAISRDIVTARDMSRPVTIATARAIPDPWGPQDPVLAAMLERSCSRRSGYDGDDEVSYGTR